MVESVLRFCGGARFIYGHVLAISVLLILHCLLIAAPVKVGAQIQNPSTSPRKKRCKPDDCCEPYPWLKYVNPELGLSFDHPCNLKVFPFSDGVVLQDSKNRVAQPREYFVITNQPFPSASKWAYTCKTDCFEDLISSVTGTSIEVGATAGKYTTVSNLSVSGFPATRFRFREDVDSGSGPAIRTNATEKVPSVLADAVFFKNDKGRWAATCPALDEKQLDERLKICNQILSSIRFQSQ